jgi:hypothetical protein
VTVIEHLAKSKLFGVSVELSLGPLTRAEDPGIHTAQLSLHGFGDQRLLLLFT